MTLDEVDLLAPLAARMRPRTFDEFLAQEHIVAPGRALRRAVEQDRIGSIILWGPPGSGKTTLALLIARLTRSHFIRLSAVTAGVADIRRAVDEARRLRRQPQPQGSGVRSQESGNAILPGSGSDTRRPTPDTRHPTRTILLIDEIHRFNKAQQDAVLQHVEEGLLTLIGATTENPSFEVNSALLSRCRVFVLRALTDEEVEIAVRRALADPERGLGDRDVELAGDALAALTRLANGDVRAALNGLELAVETTPPDAAGRIAVDVARIEDAMQHRALLYDRAGDQHYDVISAVHKSLRDSDPDGALYWIGRMLEAGEDPLYVARRLVRFASEDVGMADPMALVVAMAAQQAVHFVGLPEGNLALAQAAVYLATAPKSNALYTAYHAVQEDVRQTRADPVPLHIRNAVTGLMRGLGYGAGYRYAHDDSDLAVDQQHLPDSLEGRTYYHPTERGREAEIGQRLKEIRERRGKKGAVERSPHLVPESKREGPEAEPVR